MVNYKKIGSQALMNIDEKSLKISTKSFPKLLTKDHITFKLLFFFQVCKIGSHLKVYQSQDTDRTKEKIIRTSQMQKSI